MLTLVETKTVNNVLVDGYLEGKTPYFTREQIGSALEYDNPTDAIAKIHRRHKERLDLFSGVVSLSTPGGTQRTTVYSTRGMLEICRWSKQPKADMVMDALYDMAEEVLEKGYYSALPTDELLKRVISELEYDHYLEDVIIPIMEVQNEFTLDELLEYWCGFPVKTLDDWKRAKPIINEKHKERQRRLSKYCHKLTDYVDDKELRPVILRTRFGSPKYRGHCYKKCGEIWFDDEMLEMLKQAAK